MFLCYQAKTMRFDPIILVNQPTNFGHAIQYLLPSRAIRDDAFNKAAEILKTWGTHL
jgi:hypothetical protein